MAGKELGFSKPNGPSLKEQLARKTLRNVRLQGHTYVDLREDGKRFVFFCTLCLAPCYSDDVLFDHLRGNLHKERYAAAKATLLGPNPWPFDDGVHFFRNSEEEEKDGGSNGNGNGNGKVGLLDDHECVADLAIVVHNGESGNNGLVNGNGNGNGMFERDFCGRYGDMADGQGGFDLVIPGVICKDDVSDLQVRLMGYGQISARVFEGRRVYAGVRRIWCEWLGKRCGEYDEIHLRIPPHDFGIVTFSYYYDLGKQGLFDGIRTLLLSGGEESGNTNGSAKRRKRSFSDSEDGSESLNYQCDSSGEDSRGSTSSTSSALLVHRYDDHLLQSRIIASKSLRRELRKQQRVASEKMCDICQQKMLPGKDVATLLNLKTGKLACSSRNIHGAFHVFHTSCLIHWILLCEYEMFTKSAVNSKARRRSRRKVKSKFSQLGKECEPEGKGAKRNMSKMEGEAGIRCDQIGSVFCPDCQGTGIELEGHDLEKPTVSLSEMFKYKIKVSDAHRAWMKRPEELENCSTGFAFTVQADDLQEKVAHLKLLQIYRADEDCWPQMS